MSTDVAPVIGWTADAGSFGARLALVRQRMGWGNVKEAALSCGLPAQSWRTWERDNVVPRRIVEVARQISERTGCSYLWLLLGPETEPRSGSPIGRPGPTLRYPAAGHGPSDGRPATRPAGGPGRAARVRPTVAV